MNLKITSPDNDPWTGPVEDFLEHQEIPEFVQRRVEGLTMGEVVEFTFDFETKFTVERIS